MNFETLTLAEVETLPTQSRAAYERWFSSWLSSGFVLHTNETFDIETERRDGWGYQLAEQHR